MFKGEVYSQGSADVGVAAGGEVFMQVEVTDGGLVLGSRD